MAYTIPNGTKFATINLTRCPVTDDFSDAVRLSNNISVHRAPLFELGTDWDRDIGARSVEDYKNSTLVLLASRLSAAPTFRDQEWVQLDRHVTAFFYAILMHGIPKFWGGIAARGGVASGGPPNVLELDVLQSYYWSPAAAMPRVSAATLRGAEAVTTGLLTVFGSSDFRRLRKGILALVGGWKAHPATDRVHAFVRALDALMNLPRGQGRTGFASRLGTFVTSSMLPTIGDELYRLRSFDEHLTDWPKELAHVSIAQQPEFVSRRAYTAEATANFVYRTLLADPALLSNFRTDADIDAFWMGAGTRWTAKVDLDAIYKAFRFITR